MSDIRKLPVKKGLVAGADAGGTKVHIIDSDSSVVHRFVANDYPDFYSLFEAYFADKKVRPERISIAMGGLRDDETGAIQTTNANWPLFEPFVAEQRFPGTSFQTMHDLASVAAGIVYLPGVELIQLKSGTPAPRGPKLAVTIGTGVGTCVAAWDIQAQKYFFFSGEMGHMGFQPYTEAEYRHLAHLYTKFDHPSTELAINGKHGIVSWLEHSPELKSAPKLRQAIDRAVQTGQAEGTALLEFAKHGQGADQAAAAAILDNMGSLVGNVLADFALAYRATGGIYLTGSVSMGLAEYWAEFTGFSKAFVRHGTLDHAIWKKPMLSATPIYLIGDPNISVVGAFELAKH